MWPGLVANDFYGNANKIGRPSFYYNRFGGVRKRPGLGAESIQGHEQDILPVRV